MILDQSRLSLSQVDIMHAHHPIRLELVEVQHCSLWNLLQRSLVHDTFHVSVCT